MRSLTLAIAAAALVLSYGAASADCGAHQAKASNEVASSTSGKPLIERLIALATKQGVDVKTQ